MSQNLTAAEWIAITSLPADGKPYNVAGIAFRATHKPADKIHVEQVIAETRFGTLRRRRVRGKWQAAESISGGARRIVGESP